MPQQPYKQRLVVIGNGMAGMRVVEELLSLAPELYQITVFGAEPHPNYNRILLSPVLAGEQTFDDIILNSREWYTQNGITLHTGDPVQKIDRLNRRVVSKSGLEVVYDRLLIATGSNSFMLPVPGVELPGVIGYRDIADTESMLAAAKCCKRAVVIGGGLLGLEAANGLAVRGMEVTVVHLPGWLMERQLDPVAAGLLQSSLEERGIKFKLKTNTQKILAGQSGRVGKILFDDASEVDTDLVVMAVGIRPNLELAAKAGLQCNRGICVTDTLQTVTDPRIYAVGECANHRGISYGLVAPLYEQASVAANHLAELGMGLYRGSVISTKLKVTGINLFSVGDFMGGDDTEQIVLFDSLNRLYKKLVLKEGRLVGACLYGDTVDASWYFSLVSDRTDVGPIRGSLMFGQIGRARLAALVDQVSGEANSQKSNQATAVSASNDVSKEVTEIES